ncbi:MAG: EutN/CcmL family microcompartment protein, partial [Rhodospirillales bacterium]|nr:EutN/CcmL family microcompartment protein [Rhodospirillales bacterium]
FEVTGRAIVAIDRIGAGEGQLVLITQGSSARLADGCGKVPTDAVVIGIVDQVSLMGKSINEAPSKA